MNFTSRGARAAARSWRRPTGRQPRRHASHGGEHGHGESALHVAGGSGNESFGVSVLASSRESVTEAAQRSFYLILAGIPITYVHIFPCNEQRRQLHKPLCGPIHGKGSRREREDCPELYHDSTGSGR